MPLTIFAFLRDCYPHRHLTKKVFLYKIHSGSGNVAAATATAAATAATAAVTAATAAAVTTAAAAVTTTAAAAAATWVYLQPYELYATLSPHKQAFIPLGPPSRVLFFNRLGSQLGILVWSRRDLAAIQRLTLCLLAACLEEL